jgi:hypothetical protein
MSIDSLCSNPKILNELILDIESNIPSVGITRIVNQDNNLNIVSEGVNAIINLNDEINVNTEIIADIINAQNIFENTINFNNPSGSVVMDSSGVHFNIGNKTIDYDNLGNLNFNSNTLILNSDDNILQLDGELDQMLSSNGDGTVSWITSQHRVDGLLKGIYSSSQLSQLTEQTQVSTLSVFIGLSIDGFEVGKTSIIRLNLTFIANLVQDQTNINLIINGDAQSVLTQINSNELGVSISRSVIFKYVNTAETQVFSCTVSNVNQTLPIAYSSNTNDYYSFSIMEID